MSAEGWQDFKDYELHGVIHDLWKAKTTGILNVEREDLEKVLYLRDGIVVFASSNDPEEKLPKILISQERFTEEQFTSAKANFKDELSVGRNLVEMGLITQQELVAGAKQQVYFIFSRALNSISGRFNFEEKDLPQGVVNLPLQFPRDYVRGLMDIEDKAWISGHFENRLDAILHKNLDNPMLFNPDDLGDYAGAIFELIDGERDFNHLVFEAGVDEFTLFKYLYAMKLLDHIYLGDDQVAVEDEEAFDEPEPDVGDIRGELDAAIAETDHLEEMVSTPAMDEDAMPVMDETVALPKSIIDDKPADSMEELPGLEETAEISKSALGFEDADTAQELGIEEDSDESFDLEEEEDEEEDDTLDEETGIDDLSAMSDDMLDKELTKEESLLQDEGSGLYQSESEEGNKRLLWIAAAVIFAGALLLGLPYVPGLFSGSEAPSDSLSPDQELAIMENATGDDASSQQRPAEDEPNEETEEPQGESEVASNDPVIEADDPPTEPEAQPREPTSERVITPEERGFLSPVADGLETETAPVRRQSSSTRGNRSGSKPANSPLVTPPTGSQRAVRDEPEPRAETTSQPFPEEPAADPPETNGRESVVSDSVEAEPVRADSSPSDLESTEQNARTAMAAGDFASAAETWRALKAGEVGKFTIGIGMLCDQANLQKAIGSVGDDPRFFILPRNYNGRECFWMCWDIFEEAAGDDVMANLPDSLKEGNSPGSYSMRFMLGL